MTRPSISDEQAHIYLERAADYDRLVSAEDADGHLQKALCEALPRGTVADIGAGTGRIARMLADHATRFVLVERAAPMLEIARECLRAMDLEFVSHLADEPHTPLFGLFEGRRQVVDVVGECRELHLRGRRHALAVVPVGEPPGG